MFSSTDRVIRHGVPAPVVFRRSLAQAIRELVQGRDLLWTWTSRIVRARYEQSVLGWLWAVAQPVAQVAIFAVIFTYFVPVDTGKTPYVLFSYVALTPWTFISSSLADMSTTIVENLRLVTKIYFPREIIPIAAMLARFMDFAIASVLVLGFLWYYELPLRPSQLVLLSVLIVIQVALTLGLGLAAAAANAFLRDVRPLLILVLQLWFYASPIIYPVSTVPRSVMDWYVLNPAVGILEGYRAVWLNQAFPVAWVAWSAGVGVVCLVGGYWLFKKAETVFADLA